MSSVLEQEIAQVSSSSKIVKEEMNNCCTAYKTIVAIRHTIIVSAYVSKNKKYFNKIIISFQH